MSFAAPWHLLALALIPLVGAYWAWERRRRRRFAVRHPAAQLLARERAAAVSPWRRRIPALLVGLAALGLGTAFARPMATVDVPIEKASVMLVTDQSGSMLAQDVAPSRIEAAKSAASAFVDDVPDQLLVGFESYAGGVRTVVEPTTDHDDVRDAIGVVQAEGGTATGDALDAALDRLQTRKAKDGTTAPAAIVLLSDGKTTEGSDPLIAAARAAKLDIPVYTVALGTDDGFVLGPRGEPMAVPPDPETLRQIAERSGGRAFETAEAGELEDVYKALGSRIGTRREQREVSTAFAAGALVFLLGGLGTGVRRRGRVA